MMRKIAFLAAVAAFAGASVAHAQQAAPSNPPQRMGRGPGGRGGPGMMDNMLLKGITLSDAQKAKLEELHKADRAKMEAARGQQNGGGDFAAIREAREKGDTATANRLMAEQRTKMEARRDEQIAAIRGILTSDQQSQFDTNVTEMKKHAAERGQGRGHRPPAGL